MKKLFLTISIVLYSSLVLAITNNYATIIESGTEAKLTTITKNASMNDRESLGVIMQNVALEMLNTPYASYILDKSVPEYLWIGTEHTDCMLFVENVWAISEMIKQNRLIDINNFANNIRQIRYHGAVNYCNRNNYFTDWALSNQKRQALTDITATWTNYTTPNQIFYLSNKFNESNELHHASYQCIKDREEWLNRQKLGFLPIKLLSNYISQIKAGDIIGVVRKVKGIDVTHMGIAYLNNNKVGIIHASNKLKKVIVSPGLINYLNNFKNIQGIVVLRVIK